MDLINIFALHWCTKSFYWATTNKKIMMSTSTIWHMDKEQKNRHSSSFIGDICSVALTLIKAAINSTHTQRQQKLIFRFNRSCAGLHVYMHFEKRKIKHCEWHKRLKRLRHMVPFRAKHLQPQQKKTLRLNSGQTETGLSLTCLEIVQNNNNLYLCLVFILDKRITSIKPVYSRCVNSEIVSIGFLITA